MKIATTGHLLSAACIALTAWVLPAALSPNPASGDPLDYVKAGSDLLTRNGMDPAALTPDSFYELMGKDCATLQFGPVTLYLPEEGFKDKKVRDKTYPAAADTLGLAVPAILRALSQMGQWSRVEGAMGLEEKELADLTGMIEFEKDFDLARLDKPLTLADILGKDLNKREQAIVDKLDALLKNKLLTPTLDGKPVPPVPMLVVATRKELIEYLCVAGMVEPTLKSVFHSPGITGWMHCYFGSSAGKGRVQMLCMQEGETGEGATERWTEPSQDLDPILARHTLTYDALVALISQQTATIPNWMALGLGFEGVLSQYGNMGGRLGADSVGDVTPPRQAFVPGGQSNGGQFPPNLSALRGTLTEKELLRFLEERRKAAYKLLSDRDASDPQRKAARSGDEVVYFNFRDQDSFEDKGYLHFGPYIGQDLSVLLTKNVGYDLALIQRALFTVVARELANLEDGAALSRLLNALPGATEDFDVLFKRETGLTPSELERAAFARFKGASG
jgi:hypothetical protein